MFYKNLVWKLFLISSLVSTIQAFQTNTLQVNVTDQNSAFIPNVSIRLKNGNKIIKEFKNADSQLVIFSKLELAKYILEIEATGFKPYAQNIEIKQGKNELSVRLEVKEIVENVDVTRALQETSVEDAFSNFLTKQQLAALPENPDDIEKALKRQFGNDAVIMVDGGRGKIPPKSGIAGIRVSRSSFDAEYHQLGITYINIISKAGGGNWFGTTYLSFNDSDLNARNPFAPQRFPSQNKSYDAFLIGPIIKNKTSALISFGGSNSYKQETVNAITPNGLRQDSVRNSTGSFGSWIKLSHNLGKDKTLNITYDGGIRNSKNDGVGGFSLPERAFNSKNLSNQLRISESGYIGNRFLNEIRLQYTNQITRTKPLSDKTAVDVLDAFSDGGEGNRNKSNQQGIWLSDNLLFGVGKIHAMKIGGLLEYEKRKTESAINENGTFTFSSLNDYILGRPSTFTQSLGIRTVNLSQIQVGAFIQDDIRVHKSLMLSAGLRYEWQNNLKDYNNFSPRLGFTWSPSKTGKISFRGGAGVYYNWLETNSLAMVLSQDITQPSETVIINPSYPNPLNSGTSQVLKQSYWQLAPNLKNPYIFLSSIGTDTQLSKTTFLRVLYKFEKGVHQFRSRDVNSPINGQRPNLEFGKIVQVESSATFDKKSLNIGLNGSLNKRVSYGIQYTLSKINSDNNGIFGLPSDNYNPKLDYSVADNDQPHQIYASIFWHIRKGINLSTIFNANSSLPYTITTGIDNNGDTVFNDRPIGIMRNSERGTWQKQVDLSLSWTIGIVKKTSGSTGMIIAEGESEGDTEIANAHKYSIKIFATANNVFNQTIFTNFVGVQTSPFFRQPVSADNSRKIEFGLRFNF